MREKGHSNEFGQEESVLLCLTPVSLSPTNLPSQPLQQQQPGGPLLPSPSPTRKYNYSSGWLSFAFQVKDWCDLLRGKFMRALQVTESSGEVGMEYRFQKPMSSYNIISIVRGTATILEKFHKVMLKNNQAMPELRLSEGSQPL